MTEKDFLENGCACRCLLELKNATHKTSWDDLISSFEGEFEIWKTKPGLTDTRMICHLAKSLGLAQSIHVFRDYSRIKGFFGQKEVSGILIGVEKWPNPTTKKLELANHFALLSDINDSEFKLFSPEPNGKFSEYRFGVDGWDKLFCHALVLT